MKPRILIFTPFRNEDHSFSHYLKALKNIDYPHNLIDVLWIENDSSDGTYKLLKAAENTLDFNFLTFHSIIIRGPIKKGRPDEYRKQVRQLRGRVVEAWIILWNNNLIPILKEMTMPYVLVWFADAVPPSNVITEYLKVFEKYPDAGWVGGKCHRRFPLHNKLCAPLPREIVDATEITPALILAHVWMNPREALIKAPMYSIPREVFLSVRDGLTRQGLQPYYQPSVYSCHVSMDGKIYRYDDKRKGNIDIMDLPPLC